MFRRQDALLADIVRHNLLFHRASEIRAGQRHFCWAGLFDPRYPEASRLAKHLHQQSPSPIIAALCLGHLLLEGPKFFEFSARDCEALENFSLELPAEEYAQPFPTLMIKLPPDYSVARVQHIRSFGHVPQFVIVHHDKTHAVVLLSIRFRDGLHVAYHVALERPGGTVEQCWEELRDDVLGRVAEPLQDLAELAQSLTRLTLSACLMTMVYGVTRFGPDNSSQRQRLERHVISARKSGNAERLRNAEFDLQSLPIRYRFSQDVHLLPAGARTRSSGRWRTDRPCRGAALEAGPLQNAGVRPWPDPSSAHCRARRPREQPPLRG
jgi:hypothetical protein